MLTHLIKRVENQYPNSLNFGSVIVWGQFFSSSSWYPWLNVWRPYDYGLSLGADYVDDYVLEDWCKHNIGLLETVTIEVFGGQYLKWPRQASIDNLFQLGRLMISLMHWESLIACFGSENDYPTS